MKRIDRRQLRRMILESMSRTNELFVPQGVADASEDAIQFQRYLEEKTLDYNVVTASEVLNKNKGSCCGITGFSGIDEAKALKSLLDKQFRDFEFLIKPDAKNRTGGFVIHVNYR